MSDAQATIGGAVAGLLAPLATSALTAFQGTGPIDLSSRFWIQIILFPILGAVAVYFLAERVRRHVFVYGIAAPFLILGVFNSQKAAMTDQARQSQQAAVRERDVAEQASETANNNQARQATVANQEPARIGTEAAEALLNSTLPAL